MDKLRIEFKIKPKGVINLSTLINEKRNINENWSLNGLVMNLVRTTVDFSELFILFCSFMLFFHVPLKRDVLPCEFKSL